MMTLAVPVYASGDEYAAGGLNPGTPAFELKHSTDTGRQVKPGVDGMAGDMVARPVSVQLLIGSQGVGADFKYGFFSRFSGRIGFGLVPVSFDRVSDFSGFSTDNQLSGRFSNIHLLADYTPFRYPGFRFVGGAAYLVKADANVMITPQGNYEFGGTTVTGNQLGVINANVYWKGISPYLGVSLFRSFPTRFFNANLDVGTYYLSSPSTSFTGTKLLADNSSQEPQFNKNMQGYRWYPVIQLNFNFRIK